MTRPPDRQRGQRLAAGATRPVREDGYPDLYGDYGDAISDPAAGRAVDQDAAYNYADDQNDPYPEPTIAPQAPLPPSRGPARGLPPRQMPPPQEPERRPPPIREASVRDPEPRHHEPAYEPEPRTVRTAQPPDHGYAAQPRAEPQTENIDIGSSLSGPDVEPGKTDTSIVPATSVTGRSLTLVITIMSFLACLTAGAVYMMNQSASAWLRDIASEVTVQIEPRERAETDKLLADVTNFLKRQPGLADVKPLSLDSTAELLEPWLGQGDALKTLPVPRLIAIELNRAQPPDLDKLRSAITSQFKGVSLDDHRQWQMQIRTVTRSFALGGLAILLLVGAATTAIIVSATKSAMSSNREIVEVLHLVGAKDSFIAREFERHFLRLGIRAGVVGALCAMTVFFVIPFAVELLGGGSLSVIELKRLVGSGSLDPAGYLLLGIVVIVIAALCMLTSRWGVYRILQSQR